MPSDREGNQPDGTRERHGSGAYSSEGKRHFPATQTDPHLYLAFLREPVAGYGKDLSFSLYLPGVPAPYRTVTFKMKDMVVDGKLEL